MWKVRERSWGEGWIERMVHSINKGLKMKELRISLDKLVFFNGLFPLNGYYKQCCYKHLYTNFG